MHGDKFDVQLKPPSASESPTPRPQHPSLSPLADSMDFFSDIAGGNPYKPSLFELVAQEQLRDLLQPALKYVLSVSTNASPSGYDTG